MLIWERIIHLLSSQNREVGWGKGVHIQSALVCCSSLLGD